MDHWCQQVIWGFDDFPREFIWNVDEIGFSDYLEQTKSKLLFEQAILTKLPLCRLTVIPRLQAWLLG
jgi:hypothetical protein